MAPSAQFPRRIGIFERYHTTLHLLGLEACIVASAQYTTANGAPLTPDILFPALGTVIEKHAALGVRLEGDLSSSRARFVKLPSIYLSHIVAFAGGDDLVTTMESHLCRRFDTNSNLPLWRVEVLTDNTVLFAVHHAIADGLSLFVFHTALLKALQKAGTEDASPHVQVPDTNAMLPPMEDFTSLRPSFGEIITELYHLFAPVSWTKGNSAWTGHRVLKVPDLKAHVLLMKFSASDITSFCAACRAHGTTLTAAFQQIAISVISQIIAEDPTRKYKTICTNVAVSLRDVAGYPHDVFGDIVSSHHHFVLVSPVFDWAAAARYSTTLKLQKRAARGRVGMFRFLFGNYVAYMKDELGKKRSAGLIHSNLGRYAPMAEGKWRVGNTYFAQNESVVGPAFSINVVGDPSGGANATVSWGDKSLDRVFAECFVTQFQASFRSIIE